MEFHERLVFVLTESGITSRILYSKTTKSPTTISHYRTGRSFPDLEFFNLLKELIPDINLNWLVYGEGEPFLENKSDDSPKETKEKEQVHVTHESIEAELAKMEAMKRSMLAAFEEQIEGVRQIAIQSLEKLRGVTSVRLVTICNQFVNTQNLHLCK